MRGAIPPLPNVFMAWCLVKHRDNFTFTLPPQPSWLCNPLTEIGYVCLPAYSLNTKYITIIIIIIIIIITTYDSYSRLCFLGRTTKNIVIIYFNSATQPIYSRSQSGVSNLMLEITGLSETGTDQRGLEAMLRIWKIHVLAI
jgi:hypothetical protein